MDRSDESTRSYLRDSPYTFEGEVEFLQETARCAVRRGWGPYLRCSIHLAAMAFGIGLLAAGIGALSELEPGPRAHGLAVPRSAAPADGCQCGAVVSL
jgi:hypothetical protein